MDKQKKPKEIVGTVVSTGMNHTVVVEVAHVWHNPLYKKAIRRDRRFPAHTEDLDLQVGDKVRIVETKPISKTKHYLVVGKL